MAGNSFCLEPAPVATLDVGRIYRPRRGIVGRLSVKALDSVSLSVAAGEIVGIVGESGCGKSTLARVLAGIEPPTSGEVAFRGRTLWDLSGPARRRLTAETVAMVFQDSGGSLNRSLTVRRIVRDPMDLYGMVGSKVERNRRVEELIRLVGLPSSVLDSRPPELSGGQKQRVAIARALALDARVLVADEPTSSLDVSVQAKVLNLLIELRQKLEISVVFISHDLKAVGYVADRVAVMYLGRVIEVGAAAQVCRSPSHPYTAALMSAAPSILHSGAHQARIVLPGSMPPATSPPPGCAFHPRCWKATAECSRIAPASVARGEVELCCFHPLEATG